MKIDAQGWLVAEAGDPRVVKLPGARGRTSPMDGGAPAGVVWHWTAGPCRNPRTAEFLAQEISTFDRAKDRPASWHILIGKDGVIWQSYEFSIGTWHVGRPGRIGPPPERVDGRWTAASTGSRLVANVNRATVGVELENAGELTKVGEEFYCWPVYVDPAHQDSGPDPKWRIPASRAVSVGPKWFDGYTDAQRASALALLKALAIKYKWARDVSWYGHTMFDWPRKSDPGPLWLDQAMPEILVQVFGA